MKIGLMGGWNTNSGASFHAELIGRAWADAGHELHVFTFYDYAFHGTHIVGKDEDYVTRCFTVSGYTPNQLNPVPFLTADYDIFVVEDLGMLPKDLLAKIFHRIKMKAKTVNVIHDGKLSEDPAFYQFSWDALVCFDERYKNFLVHAYDKEPIYTIPYPCYPLKKGDKKEARKKLGLPLDKKIIFAFGPAANTTLELIPAIAQLSRDYPLLFLVVTKDQKGLEKFHEVKEKGILDIELREQAPDIEELYQYLHAADALLFNKPSAPHVVVSSTVFQCLGSGCPIIAKSTNFIQTFQNELLKFSNQTELQEKLRAVFDQTQEYKEVLKAAEEYVNNNSASAIADRYIDLFNKLLT
jgi:glycosyltransferase involved in cell wall biosynthesis